MKKLIIISISIVFFLFGIGVLSAQELANGRPLIPVKGLLFAYTPTEIADFGAGNYKYAREPVLRRMPDGSLFCLHYTGGPTEPDDDNVIVATKSVDNGMTWSAPYVLFEHQENGVWGPEMFVQGNDVYIPVHTFHTSSHYDKLKVYPSVSRDAGKSWSEPAGFPGFANSFSLRRGIVLSNGEWFFPAYCQEPTKGFWSDPRKYRTFCSSAFICKPGWEYIEMRGYHKRDDLGALWEPNAVEVSPGHIVMFMRASGTGVLYRTDSYDWGRTWTKAKSTDIPNGDSKITLFKIDGKVILLGNQCSDRSSVALWVSEDGCDSWNKKIMLVKVDDKADRKSKICYPDGFVDFNEKVLYVALDQYSSHYLIKVPFEDFL